MKKNRTTADDVSHRLSYLAQATAGSEAGSDYGFLQLEYLEHCIRTLERQTGRSAPTYLAFVKAYDDGPLPSLAREERRRLARDQAGAA